MPDLVVNRFKGRQETGGLLVNACNHLRSHTLRPGLLRLAECDRGRHEDEDGGKDEEEKEKAMPAGRCTG